jgi:hypothetical protein
MRIEPANTTPTPTRNVYAITGGITYPASGGAMGTEGLELRWSVTLYVVATSMERALTAVMKSHPGSIFERAELLGEVDAFDKETPCHRP